MCLLPSSMIQQRLFIKYSFNYKCGLDATFIPSVYLQAGKQERSERILNEDS